MRDTIIIIAALTLLAGGLHGCPPTRIPENTVTTFTAPPAGINWDDYRDGFVPR